MNEQAAQKKEIKRVLVVSDIHSCASNLQKILADLPEDPDLRVCLGDVVGSGYDPGGSVELVKDFDILIKGEFDEYCGEQNAHLRLDYGPRRYRHALAIAGRDKQRLSRVDQKELRSYHYSYWWESFLFFHNSHRDGFDGDLSKPEAVSVEMDNWPAISVFVCGHLRYPCLAQQSIASGELTLAEEIADDSNSSFELELNKYRYLINVPAVAFGAVTYSYPGYCILTRLEAKRWRLEFRFLKEPGCEILVPSERDK